MTEKDRCIANIYALAKKKNILIRDLEKSCDVSVGYLARLRQDKKQSLPGSEFLFRAAALLGTNVDSLMYFDFNLASETDLYLHSFLTKLLLDSLKQKIVWTPDSDCVPSPVVLESEVKFPDHPLLALDPVLLQQGKSKEYYYSPFHPAAYDLTPRAAWRTSLSAETLVFMTCVERISDGDTDAPEDAVNEIELYLYNTAAKALSPLCHADPQQPGLLYHDLSELYETVSELLNRNALDQYAISAIDAYLADDKSADL